MENNLFENIEGGRAVDSDSLYYPMFRKQVSEKTYLVTHRKLITEMRMHLRLKNRQGIEQTGKKLHCLRKKYRARFAA